jgi:hypothetical protein
MFYHDFLPLIDETHADAAAVKADHLSGTFDGKRRSIITQHQLTYISNLQTCITLRHYKCTPKRNVTKQRMIGIAIPPHKDTVKTTFYPGMLSLDLH